MRTDSDGLVIVSTLGVPELIVEVHEDAMPAELRNVIADKFSSNRFAPARAISFRAAVK